MPVYQVEEFDGDRVVASTSVIGEGPKVAAETVAGRPLSPRALQAHWFRVVDERQAMVYEFSLAETSAPPDFAK
jgi:hypothetical protein